MKSKRLDTIQRNVRLCGQVRRVCDLLDVLYYFHKTTVMKRVSGVLERLEELFNERNIEALHRAFKKNEKLTEFDGIATQMADYVMPLKITVDAIQEAEKLDINLTARWGIVLDEIKDEVAQLDDAIKQKYCEFIEREEKKKQRKKKRKEVGDEGHTDSRRRDSQANA